MKKKNLYNKAAVVSLVAVMTAGSANAAFAGQWQQDAKGWKFQTGANTFHTNGWQWLDGNGDGIAECYYFGNDGYMIANGKTPDGYTVNTDGAWTENNTVKTQDNRITVPNGTWLRGTGANANKWWFKYTDGSYPANKWVWLDGNNDGIAECYYFDANGWCVANGTTPDGFSVNADGAWVTGSVAVRKPAKHAATGGPSGGSGTTVSKEAPAVAAVLAPVAALDQAAVAQAVLPVAVLVHRAEAVLLETIHQILTQVVMMKTTETLDKCHHLSGPKQKQPSSNSRKRILQMI